MRQFDTPQSLPRRRVLQLAAAGALATATPSLAASGAIKAIAFDGFVAFDPRPITVLAEALFPGRGNELGNAWRTRQFEYTWLRTLTQRYADFWQVTEEALVFAAELLKLDLTPEKRDRLMQAFLELKAHPDVRPALETLRAGGVRLAFLSNLTEAMLVANTRGAGLQDLFEAPLSTDRVKAFKPDPRAYGMAIDAFGLKREEIAFAAFGGWDAAGAKSFGYATFWNNRLNLPVERLGVAPDAIGNELGALVRFAAG